MKTLYIECNMGAAGDILMAALLELHPNHKDFLNKLNNVGIPGVVVIAEVATKCGVKGTNVNVRINGHTEGQPQETAQQHLHHHSNYYSIEHLIEHLKVSDFVKKNVLEVYKLIANAESHIHGEPVNKIHFHEVGEMDAVTDIVGVCMAIEELAPDLVLASPINLGSGQVRCAHGILPVPAPATAYILQNIPIYSDGTDGELCTPTGAALLKHFVHEFRNMPVIAVSKIGYGMGKKDFEKANCLRAYFGIIDSGSEDIVELVCNIDDMTPEAIAFAQQLLLKEGALDAYTTPAGMKKGRVGLIFTCLCRTEAKNKMLSLIFKHTTTLGIREHVCRRYALHREQKKIQTKFGTVNVKISHGFGIEKFKAEHEDVAKIALEHNKSIQEVLKDIF